MQLRAERSRVPNEETLPAVAEAYRTALRDPQYSHRATARTGEVLGYSRGHAARLIRKARDEKLLGEAEVGMPGEVMDDENQKRGKR